MENPKQENAVQIGNTTFYVTSVFSGTVQLEYLIKRLIQKEIEFVMHLDNHLAPDAFCSERPHLKRLHCRRYEFVPQAA